MNSRHRRLAAAVVQTMESAFSPGFVEISGGQVVRYGPLDGETPATEYLGGGTITIKTDGPDKRPAAYYNDKLITENI